MLLQILNYSNDKANTKKRSSELSRGQTSRREAAGARGPPGAPPHPGRAATHALGGQMPPVQYSDSQHRT